MPITYSPNVEAAVTDLPEEAEFTMSSKLPFKVRRLIGGTFIDGCCNYEPNRAPLKRGDLVLHDCDAKTQQMLMLVVAELPGGDIQTEYVDDELQAKWGKRGKSRLINRPTVLHPAHLFHIEPGAVVYSQRIEADIQRVMKARRFNREQAVKVVLEANCVRAGKGK